MYVLCKRFLTIIISKIIRKNGWGGGGGVKKGFAYSGCVVDYQIALQIRVKVSIIK